MEQLRYGDQPSDLERALLQGVADAADLEEVAADFPYVKGSVRGHMMRIHDTLRVSSNGSAALIALWVGWIQ